MGSSEESHQQDVRRPEGRNQSDADRACSLQVEGSTRLEPSVRGMGLLEASYNNVKVKRRRRRGKGGLVKQE